MRDLFHPLRRGLAPILAAACALPACGAIAAPDASGRWEGSVAIPGNPLRLIIDLEPDARGRWQGSAVLPDRGVKGAPLSLEQARRGVGPLRLEVGQSVENHEPNSR